MRKLQIKMGVVCNCKLLFGVVVLMGMMMGGDVLAKQHVVGGSQGWDESTDFNSWASAQTFKVGDQLVFKYTPGLHSVVELGGESAYKNCDIGSAVDSLNGGDNVVKLNKPGTRYFACGTLGHCDQGMKVKIRTVTAAAAAGASATPASSSSSPASTSAAPGSRSFATLVSMPTSLLLIISFFIPLF